MKTILFAAQCLSAVVFLAGLDGCSNSDCHSCGGAGAGDFNAGGAGQTSIGSGGAATSGAGAMPALGGAPGFGGAFAFGGAGGVAGSSDQGGAGAADGGSSLPGDSAKTSKGWLYTAGNRVYRSEGANGGKVWVGRGVNIDDVFLCGANYALQNSNAEASLKTELDHVFNEWKPTFLRISLSLNSFPAAKASWLTDDPTYKTPMTNVIKSVGNHPDAYVLVTLRTDASMIDQQASDPEPTGVPSDATNTPDKARFPNGTDAAYIALVDSFAKDNFVLFGISNEPGGYSISEERVSSAMVHAVATIRAEEDRLHVPHHIVAVQGNYYTSNVAFYDKKPFGQDNVVYEVHAYPPKPEQYTFENIPVILGEYGPLPDSAAFYRDVEAKQVPTTAWDLDPFSNCAPDLVTITGDASKLAPSDWGKTVQAYLLSHAGD